jgi:ABC-2 type transport system permease protein
VIRVKYYEVKTLLSRYKYSIILLKQLVKTDFKLRYQGSLLGYVWSLLKPLALFVILYIVFTKFIKLGAGVENYAIYLLLGIVIWTYFVEVTVGSIGSIVSKGDLIRKINFPKYVIVLASSFSALINLGINLVVVLCFMFVKGVDIEPMIILLPLLILELFVFSLALAFFLSAAFVRFRDVSHIWDVFMQGAFYATPIIYPLSIITGFTLLGITFTTAGVQKLLLLNPMAQIIQDARYITVTQSEPTISSLFGTHWARLIPIGITVILVVFSAHYFRKRSKYFAEEV